MDQTKEGINLYYKYMNDCFINTYLKTYIKK